MVSCYGAGSAAVQEAWRRIWNGFIAYQLIGTVGQDITAELIRRHTERPVDGLQQQLVDLITRKAPYAKRNHVGKQLGAQPLNEWFDDPSGLLGELQRSGFIIPGKPEISPFFRLTSFNGPLFKVFSDEELSLWQAWTYALGAPPQPPLEYDVGASMAHVLNTLRERQMNAQGHGVLLEGPDPDTGTPVVQPLSFWFLDINGSNADGPLPDGISSATRRLMQVLANPKNGWVVPFDVAHSPLVTRMLSGNGPMAKTLQAVAPRSNGKSYRDVVVDWINAGCPQPHQKPEMPPQRPPARGLRAMVEAAAGAPAKPKKIRGRVFLH